MTRLAPAGRIRHSRMNKLEFVLGALADFIPWKFCCDMLQQVFSQVALATWSLGQAKSQRKHFFRRETFFFLQRLKQRISRAAVEIRKEFHGGMLPVAHHGVRMEFELSQAELIFVLRLKLGKFPER